MYNQIFKSKRNKFLHSILICIFIFGMVIPALAAGDGSGTGGGGGAGAGTNPLHYVSANLTTISGDTATPGASITGSTTVPADATFELQFDKNVISDVIYNEKTVYANNQACIVLQDGSGNVVSANIYRLGSGDPADTEKRNIFVKPTNSLVGGQQYEIIVSPKLIANNGLTLDSQQIIDFTVQSASIPTPTPVPVQTPVPVPPDKTTVEERIGGSDRYETAVKIAQDYFAAGADAAVLTRGDSSSDALAAVPLAKHFNAPLLLTPQDQLPDQVLTEIKTLGVKTVYIVGGEMAVSSQVADVISGQGITIQRIAGPDRYATAYQVAKLLGNTDQAVIVDGNDEAYPDALSISSWAAYNGAPILYADGTNTLPEDTAKALTELKVTRTILVGGTAVLPQSLEGLVPNPERYAGVDRYDTNIQVLSKLQPNPTQIFVATGNNFADALAGAAVAGQTNAWLILTGNSQATGSGLTSEQQQLVLSVKGVKDLHVLGGTVAVPDATLNEMKKDLGF